MKKLTIPAMVIMVLCLPVMSACHSDTGETHTPVPTGSLPSSTGTEAPDDIIFTPGGSAYRANVNPGAQDNPIQTTDVVLVGGTGETMTVPLNITYRDYIETKAGETRNNIIFINQEGGLFDKKLELYSSGVPDGIKLSSSGEGGRPGVMLTVLAIKVSSTLAPGQYAFRIGIIIDGKDYGTIPCTINVTVPATPTSIPTPPPIPASATPIPTDYSLPVNNAQQAPDDIIIVPGLGGIEYRANIHEQGKPYIPLRVEYVYLDSGSDTVAIKYRNDITTKAGETRNNLIYITIPGDDVDSDDSLILYAVDVPVGITLRQGMGDISTGVLLRIDISGNVTIGEYAFKIGFIINYKDYGTLPCTINVIE